MEHFRNIHSQFKRWIISSIFQMDKYYQALSNKLILRFSSTIKEVPA